MRAAFSFNPGEAGNTIERAKACLDAHKVCYSGKVVILLNERNHSPSVLNACDYLCEEHGYHIRWI